jgi:hypothetical protein
MEAKHPHSPSSSAKVNTWWRFTSTLPCVLTACFLIKHRDFSFIFRLFHLFCQVVRSETDQSLSITPFRFFVSTLMPWK